MRQYELPTSLLGVLGDERLAMFIMTGFSLFEKPFRERST